MKTKTTFALWSEPPKVRFYLLGLSGGIRRLFFSYLLTEGLPIVVFMLAIWLIGLRTGSNVSSFKIALTMFLGLGVSAAIFQCLLYFLIRSIQITATHVRVGGRKWRKKIISNVAWEAHTINGTGYDVLAFSTRRGEIVRVTAPIGHSKEELESLILSGSEK